MSNKERPIKIIEATPQDFTEKTYNFGKKQPIRTVTTSLKIDSNKKSMTLKFFPELI